MQWLVNVCPRATKAGGRASCASWEHAGALKMLNDSRYFNGTFAHHWFCRCPTLMAP